MWRAKSKADDDQDSGSSAAPINMVFIMPEEFMAPCDEDCQPELEEAMAQLNLEPLPTTFEKPEDEKRQHLKALFLKGFIGGKPVTKMLVDGGVAVNIMPYVMLRKLGKSQDDLTKTDMMLKGFEGVVSPALGALALISPLAVRPFLLLSSLLMARVHTVCYWVGIGFMSIVAFHPLCINV